MNAFGGIKQTLGVLGGAIQLSCLVVQQSFAAEEGIGIGVAACEIFVENAWVLTAAFGEDFAFIFGCGFGVVEAAFQEEFERIGVQDFCPFVAVIACGVTAGENVGEACRHGAGEAREEGGFSGDFVFEFSDVFDVGGIASVVGHVHHAEIDLAQAAPAAHEILRRAQFFDEIFGDFVFGFEMFGEHIERFFFVAPVFLHLAGQFDEIPEDGCSGEGTICDI